MGIGTRTIGGVAAAWLAVSLAAAAPPGPAGSPAPPPSVLLITLDTTRADRLGCYGGDDAATPFLDALAGRGVRFATVTSPAPLTVPAHASILTGRVPRRHGARDNERFPLPGGVPTLAEALRARGYGTAAAVGAFVLDRGAGLARGFEVYDDDVRVGAREEFAYEERAASSVADAAIAAAGRLEPPFLLWAHFFDPHEPYVPPEPYRSRFSGRPYEGEIAFVDAEVGRLVGAIREKTEDLLIVVVGDHGESLGEHGERTHGLFLYEATQRVPWILIGPGVPAGRTVPSRVGLVDVAPTVLDLVGAPPLEDTDGRSVVPLFRDGPDRPAGAAYEMETLYPFLAYGWAPLHGLVADGWKYVRAPRPELYDLASDRGETRDLAAAEPARASALAARLDRLLAGDTIEAAAGTGGPEAAERRRRLASLGYVAGGPATPSAEAIDPKDGVRLLADLDRARRLAAAGDPAGCVDALRPLLAANQDNVPALLTLSSCRLATGNAEGALAAAETAERVRPGDDLVALHRAGALAALAETGERPAAEVLRAFEEAVDRNPRRADTWLDFAGFVARSVGPEEALAVLARADDAGVAGPDLEVTRGIDLLRLGRPDEAEAAFERAVERNPHDAQTLGALARLRQKRDDPVGAARWLERLLEVAPSWDVAAALGAAREAAGDRAAAIAAYRRALALLPPDAPDRSGIERRIESLRSDGSGG